jgi:HTH-type transcriptional regulator/antitoxin HipB
MIQNAKRRRALLRKLLRAQRERVGLQQIELSKLLKRSPTWATQWERGATRRLDLCDFLTIAEVIGFDPHAMIRELLRAYPPTTRKRSVWRLVEVAGQALQQSRELRNPHA